MTQYMATDINRLALEATEKTSKLNGCEIEAIQMNLADNMLEKMCGKVDVLVFNPPYVVTSQKELS